MQNVTMTRRQKFLSLIKKSCAVLEYSSTSKRLASPQCLRGTRKAISPIPRHSPSLSRKNRLLTKQEIGLANSRVTNPGTQNDYCKYFGLVANIKPAQRIDVFIIFVPIYPAFLSSNLLITLYYRM